MLIFISIVVPLVVGGAIAIGSRKLNLRDLYGNQHRITGLEFGVVSAFIVLLALLLTVVWGPDAARAQAANGYLQFLNGSVTKAWAEETTCSRDGPCVHEYPCDPYLDTETYTETETYVGADGQTQSRTVMKTRTVTKYHQCPEATHEYTYLLDTNLGETLTVASHIFAANPVPWRQAERISPQVARGEPERWLISKQRLEAGDAEPVTVVDDYTNFILPSEGTLYEQYDGSVAGYREAGLLPEHTQNLADGAVYDVVPQARKVQFVGGLSADGIDIWQDRLMRFNAVLGPAYQGDLHIVAMPAAAVSNPQDYLNALMAYWQSDLGKWGFPKNGIALVLGVGDDGSIEWSRAKTGMPEGNGAMLSAMTLDLEGKRFNPDVLLGKVTASAILDENGEAQLTYAGSDGLLGQIMFREYPFKRACMGCTDADDNGTGYVFLKDSIPVSAGAQALWFFIILFVSLGLWAAALFFDPARLIRGHNSASAPDLRYRHIPPNRRF